jgi:hypothetical protein
VRYEPATAATLSLECQPATRALGHAIGDVFPELTTMRGAYGCWNRRRIEGSSSWSLHAEGRALDVGVAPPDDDLGWSVVCHLVERRTLYGTMRVMWAGHIWSTERRDVWRRLTPGTNQHLDHFHVEQYWAAARRPYATSLTTFRKVLGEHRRTIPIEA